MVRVEKVAGNPGYKAGMGKRSGKYRIGVALMGAPERKKDLRLNAIAGVAEARKLRDKVTALMLKAEAEPGDGVVYAVFAEPDLSAFAKVTTPVAEVPVTNGASDLAIAARFVDKLPIGFLVFVRDVTDEKRPILGHMRPLIVEDPRAIALTRQAFNRVTNMLKRRMGIDESN